MTRRAANSIWDGQPLDYARPLVPRHDAADHISDLRIRQLRLRIHPPINWLEAAVMASVALLLGILLAVQF